MFYEEHSGTDCISSDSICSQAEKISIFIIMQFNVAFPSISNLLSLRDSPYVRQYKDAALPPCSYLFARNEMATGRPII
jgi:hypothetical protein